jgi:hypothetical protein
MRTRHRARLGLIAGFAALAAGGLIACGTETLDEGDAEAFVTDYLAEASTSEVGTVDCPSDVEIEADATFDCTAESPDGEFTATITVLQQDDDGNVTIETIEVDGETADVSDAAPWEGRFDSTFGELALTPNGVQVTGSYDHCDGQIVGIASGSALSGNWEENPDACPPEEAPRPDAAYSGTFEFELSSDASSFTGSFTYADGGQDTAGNVWEGTRISDTP